MLHKEILSEEQVLLLPALKRFKEDFGLVGGTAIALHIGHRESIDFDLFTKDPSYAFQTGRLKWRFSRLALLGTVMREREEELTFRTQNGVQITFFHFPHCVPFTVPLDNVIHIPSISVLAAMKAYALGYRSKWKDYVDLYFILRDHLTIDQISAETQKLFPDFNERLLRQQLGFFDDINYKEPITFKPGFEVPEYEIKRTLTEISLS
jgi:hypothetical protein